MIYHAAFLLFSNCCSRKLIEFDLIIRRYSWQFISRGKRWPEKAVPMACCLRMNVLERSLARAGTRSYFFAALGK